MEPEPGGGGASSRWPKAPQPMELSNLKYKLEYDTGEYWR
jgi:hypothetical protein